MLDWSIMNGDINLLAQRMRRLREGAGLSQVKLARLLNSEHGISTHQTNLSAIERNESLPSVQLLTALADVLETNTDYLLGRTDDDKPSGNLDDQVVVVVEDPDERRIVQEVADAVAGASRDDKILIAGWISRILPKKPRIIGDE